MVLGEIFDMDGISPISIIYSDSRITIDSTNLPDLDVWTDTGFNREISPDIRVISSYGYKDCELYLVNLDSNCDVESCDAFIGNYNDLLMNGCLDNPIPVVNPFIIIQSDDFVGINFPEFQTNSFAPLSGDFVITPNPNIPGPWISTYDFIIDSAAPHNTRDAAVLILEFVGYNNDVARICPELIRLDYTIGEETFDAESQLLISGSRAVTGYYQIGGSLYGTGPFLFTAKVWLRK
jgi:hypothetical protein